jgi:hypothetical protein
MSEHMRLVEQQFDAASLQVIRGQRQAAKARSA